ncbi:MAG: SIMPL domain-containing protein [Candidatus Marsarchaeota archaeon]|nr:SIMPL domain-containing protein [Candidatus Marsarchaeota archaeon]
MKTEHYAALIAIFAILVMGAMLAIGLLYPKGLVQSRKAVAISATGSSSAIPGMGTVSIYANATGDTAAAAAANLSTTLARLNSTLLGYANAGNITTMYYSIGIMRNTSTYVATEGVRAIINDANSMTEVLRSLSSHENVYVQNAGTMLSNSQASRLLHKALQNALKNATAQAEALTGNATLTAVNITTTNYRVYAPISLGAAATGLASPAPSGQLFFNGNESIVESVQVVFTYS